jgi:acetoin utilization protein AcuA
MKHVKQFNKIEIRTNDELVIVEGPVTSEQLAEYYMDMDLTTFRPANQQYEALKEIVASPEGRLIIARVDKRIIGYVTYHYPDELERWSESKMDNLLELGAIEVVADYRSSGIAQNLLKVTMLDDAMEDYIIIATNYYWHWDLYGTGLTAADYRKIIRKVMLAGNLEYMPTDDPDICTHSANCLTVRIGSRVSDESIRRFDAIRLKNQYMY